MIIKGKTTDYLIIPIEELYNEIDILETEIIVHNYDQNNELRIIAEAKIQQLKELMKVYE